MAEVLITLGVIGIVAAMTLPTVINDAKDRQFRAMWKKTFSVVANAYNYAYQDDPTYFEKINTNKMAAAAQLYYRIFSNLNTYNYCVSGASEGKICPPNGQGITNGNINPPCSSLNNDKPSGESYCMWNGSGGVAFLNDGTVIYAHGYLWNYPQLLVDVNGKKGPNVVGRDMYIILFSENRVIPGGAEGYELKGCDKNISSDSGAYDAERFSGSGCGAKYLLE